MPIAVREIHERLVECIDLLVGSLEWRAVQESGDEVGPLEDAVNRLSMLELDIRSGKGIGD